MGARTCSAAIALIGALNLGAAPAGAESLRQLLKADIRLSSDLTVTETIHQETTALAESAVRSVAQSSWSVNGNQTFEIVEAFTRKADGRTVPADPRDFASQAGSVGAAMSYIDVKVQQIPFRDLGVGDTAVLTIRIVEKGHYIPGFYSRSVVLAPTAARRSLDVTLHAPATLDVHHDEQQLTYEESRQGDEIVRHWSGASAPADVDEKNIADIAFTVPALRISTFPGFEAMATAYFAQAKDKAAVTPEVQALADQITRDKTEVRDQAQAIYEWVTRNIRYVAVYFGKGRYVPNDAATILSRRFGDCKDDATLLTALLAAKGIASEEVLIGTIAAYRLPKTATLSAFNHVIVYIPALDRYVDPTAAFGNFNRLPSGDSGKPVVRVSDKGAVVARTPVSSVDDNVVELDSRITVGRDGQRTSQTTISARGDFADVVRGFVAQTEARGKDVVLQGLAQQRGLLSGGYDLDAPPWTDAREPYRVTLKWTMPKPGASEPRVRPPASFSPVLPHPSYFFGAFNAAKRLHPSACRPGRMVHTMHVALPDDVAAVKLPPPIKKSTPQFVFRDEWTRDGQQLRRRTEVVSMVSERVCTPAEIDAVNAAIRSVGTTTSPQIAFNKGGTATPGGPSLMQQLFGQSSGSRPPEGAPASNTAAPARGRQMDGR